MLEKKDKTKGEGCPFRGFKDCSNQCKLFRRGTRTNDLTGETTFVEDCSINVIADNIEMVHNRSFMLQKEVGQTKNVIAFDILSKMGIVSKEEAETQAKKILIPIIEEIEIQKKELPEK
jgi:hypothetical protein